MSNEALVVLDNNAGGLVAGGLGLGSRLFKVKPATLEVVAKTTQQEGATPGRLRIRETGDQFDELQLVMLVPPQEQREWYDSKTEFGSEHKLCFSLDNIQPHLRAKEAQSPVCRTCSKGDKNWEIWRKDKRPENLPQCRKYWHLVVADRHTKMPYYFNIKGTAIQSFEQQMQNLARIIALMEATAKAENKKLRAEYEAALDADVPKGMIQGTGIGEWKGTGTSSVPAPVYKAMPNIFDITFTVKTTQLTKGGPWVPAFSSFLALKEEDKAEFGALYLDFVSRKTTAEPEEEEAPATEAPSIQEVEDVLGPMSGMVIPKGQEITI